MIKKLAIAAVVVITLAITVTAKPADEAPAWLQQARVTPPTYERDVPAVVLPANRYHGR